MKRLIYILGGIGVVIVLVFISFLIIAKAYLTEERIRDFTENTIEKTLKKEAEIRTVSPFISFFRVGVTANEIKIYEKEKKLLSVEKLIFHLRLLPLIFRKSFEIEKLVIERPHIVYKLTPPKKEKKKEKKEEEKIELPLFLLEKLQIIEGKLDIVPVKGKNILIEPFNLELYSKTIDKNKILFKGKGNFEISKFEFFDFPLEFNFNFFFDLGKEFLDIEKFLFKFKSMQVKLKGKISDVFSAEPEYNIKLESDKVPVSILKLFSDIKDIEFNGFLILDLDIKGKKEKYSVRGNVIGKELKLSIKDREITFEKFNIDFKGKRAYVDAFVKTGMQKTDIDIDISIAKPFDFKGFVNFYGNFEEFTKKDKAFLLKTRFKGNLKGSMEIEGNFESERNEFSFSLKNEIKNKKYFLTGSFYSGYLNINDFTTPEQKEKGGKQKGPVLILPKGIEIYLKGKIKKLIAGKEELKNVNFDVHINEKGIRIKNLKGNIYGGKIEGKLDIFPGSIIIKSYIKGENLEFSEILKKHKFGFGKIKGRLKIESRTSFDIKDISSTLSSENAVIVIDGIIEEDPLFDKIADILKFDPFKSFNFKNLKAKIEIEKGWIRFPDFVIKGKDFDIFPKGKVSIKGDMYLKMKIALRGSFAKYFRTHSVFSNYFKIKEGVIPFYLIVKGNYKNPYIKIDMDQLKKEIEKEIKKKVRSKIKKKVKEEIEKGLEELRKKLGF